jgi:predicted GIY-YIG superfamily endonuclease
MKECSKCLLNKSLDSFSKNGKYIRSDCKSCRNVDVKKRLKLKRSKSLYYVYYLPEHNYCGITIDVDQRMRDHRRVRNSKDTTGMRILFISDNKKEAAYHEAMFQSVLCMEGLSMNY